MCRSLTYQLRLVRKVSRYLDNAHLKTVIQAMFTSRLDYANSLLVGAPMHQIKRLQTLQNSAARLVTGTSIRDHITPILKDLYWLPVEDRITFKISCLVYRTLTGTAPSYMTEMLDVYKPNARLRSAQKGPLLKISKTKTHSYSDRRFAVAAPNLWN